VYIDVNTKEMKRHELSKSVEPNIPKTISLRGKNLLIQINNSLNSNPKKYVILNIK
jgi:hypothetical protein